MCWIGGKETDENLTLTICEGKYNLLFRNITVQMVTEDRMSKLKTSHTHRQMAEIWHDCGFPPVFILSKELQTFVNEGVSLLFPPR